jgi:hypothetical protein
MGYVGGSSDRPFDIERNIYPILMFNSSSESFWSQYAESVAATFCYIKLGHFFLSFVSLSDHLISGLKPDPKNNFFIKISVQIEMKP